MILESLIIGIISFIASGLTLFSGFGLATIVTPTFVLFFPVEVAVVLTAIVHFLNNIFKFFLVGKNARLDIVVRFGLPALLAAFLGSQFLFLLNRLPEVFAYSIGTHTFHVTAIKLTIGILMAAFVLFEMHPRFKNLSFDQKYLSLGGVLSGFFGGLSGHQGALRSAFLVKAGLSKEAFIATGVVVACLVDVTRVFVYAAHIHSSQIKGNFFILLIATLCAFMGAFLGNRLVKKVTTATIQKIVSVMLFIIAVLLTGGLI